MSDKIKCPNYYSGLKCEGELWWWQEPHYERYWSEDAVEAWNSRGVPDGKD